MSKRGGRGNATQFEQSVFSVNAECSRLNTRSHTRSHVHVQFTHTFTHAHARSHTFNVRERVRTCMNEHERAEQARGTAHLPGLAATTRRVHFRGRLPQTPAAFFRTPTQTRPEKHVQPRRRARRKRCASPSRVCAHSKRSKLDSCRPAARAAWRIHGPGRGPSPDCLDRARGSLQRRNSRRADSRRPPRL